LSKKTAIEQWNFLKDATGGSGGRHKGIDNEIEAERGARRRARVTMLTPARSRPSSTSHCPRCKLRLSKPASTCPSNADKRCTCCDLCRRECALDAKGSELKRS